MTTDQTPLDFSIVIPVYFNEGSLSATMDKIKSEVLARHAWNCEVIYVDDGSGDGSLNELLGMCRANPGLVKVVKFTRNFGQVQALMAGYNLARGKCVISLSADGQDPVSLINDMLKAHFEERCEIVICAREGRDESAYRIWTSRLFYALMRVLGFGNMPPGGFDYVLLGRKAVDAILRNREAHPFWQGQILWTGFKPKIIPYHRLQRTTGKSRWSFGRKLTYLLDGILSYSFVPIRLMSLAGIAVAFSGFLYAALILILRLLGGIPVQGWAPLMIIVLLLGGFQMLMLGIIGEYVWRTLAQSRQRAPYVIEEIFN